MNVHLHEIKTEKFFSIKKLVFLMFISISTMSSFSQTTYNFDKNHARLGFSALHFGISHVDGNFKNFDATLKATKEDFSDAVIEVSADVNSINTENDMRDKDLKNESWFDAEKFPSITFKSNAFKKLSGNNYVLEGFLTMKGVSKFIRMNVAYNGKSLNPYTKKYMYGFTITAKINRTDFKIGTNTMSNVVGNDIEIKSNVEFDAN